MTDQDFIDAYIDHFHTKSDDIRIIARYKNVQGYMALIRVYGTFCLFFLDTMLVSYAITRFSASHTELGVVEKTETIAQIIGATKL